MLNRIKLFGLFFLAIFLVFSLEVNAEEETVNALDEKVNVEEEAVSAEEEKSETKTIQMQVSYTTPTGRRVKTFSKSRLVEEGPAFVLSHQQWEYIRLKLKKSGSVKMPRVAGGRELRGATFKVRGLFSVRNPVIQIGEKGNVNLNAISSQKK